MFPLPLLRQCIALFAVVISLPVMAVVMKPETSMAMINEAEGGGSLNVTNTSDDSALLYVKVYDLPDDKQPQVLVTQPVTRLEAGKTQRVRFILNAQAPLTTEHMKRVILEGIAPKTDAKQNSVDVSIRQDLPIIIHPKNLAPLADPWTKLVWKMENGKLIVSNPSPYVIRIVQSINLLPSMTPAALEKTYILPNQTQSVKVADPRILASSKEVRIQAMSKYGYEVGSFEMPITH